MDTMKLNKNDVEVLGNMLGNMFNLFQDLCFEHEMKVDSEQLKNAAWQFLLAGYVCDKTFTVTKKTSPKMFAKCQEISRKEVWHLLTS